MTVFIIIEREHSADLAIEYPDADTAEHALDNSPFIDGLCEEDCLDAYVIDEPTFTRIRSSLQNVEHVIPPDECANCGSTTPDDDKHDSLNCWSDYPTPFIEGVPTGFGDWVYLPRHAALKCWREDRTEEAHGATFDEWLSYQHVTTDSIDTRSNA